jgi:predicted transcriptional regulator
MQTSDKSLLHMTASDLMTQDLVLLRDDMPLRKAAMVLLENQVGGAPVIDEKGKCVGVLSATDFLRLAVKRADVTKPLSPPLPITCPFQAKHRRNGEEVILCTLPPGVCPIQVRQKNAGGREIIVCSQPHCVLTDWQVIDVEKLPIDEVRNYMTADPATVVADTPIRVLALRMIDAHVHRLIVVDKKHRPVGIVSTTDVLAAVAYSESEP